MWVFRFFQTHTSRFINKVRRIPEMDQENLAWIKKILPVYQFDMILQILHSVKMLPEASIWLILCCNCHFKSLHSETHESCLYRQFGSFEALIAIFRVSILIHRQLIVMPRKTEKCFHNRHFGSFDALIPIFRGSILIHRQPAFMPRKTEKCSHNLQFGSFEALIAILETPFGFTDNQFSCPEKQLYYHLFDIILQILCSVDRSCLSDYKFQTMHPHIV